MKRHRPNPKVHTVTRIFRFSEEIDKDLAEIQKYLGTNASETVRALIRDKIREIQLPVSARKPRADWDEEEEAEKAAGEADEE
jgi:antitoxin component of RelBE/YafQ-DinJ toxin-antitoxin module